MTRWNPADAQAVSGPQEVEVATRRRDGSLRPPRTIWIVGEDPQVHVRSTNGREAAWYKGAVGSSRGQVIAGGRTWDVEFSVVTDEATLARVDAGYRAKYGQYAAIVDHLLDEGPRAATLRVDPA